MVREVTRRDIFDRMGLADTGRIIWAVFLASLVLAAVSIVVTWWYITVPLAIGLSILGYWLWRRAAPKREAAAIEQRKAQVRRAARLVVATQSASRTMLERELHVHPAVAVAILDVLEAQRIVSAPTPSGRRRVLIRP